MVKHSSLHIALLIALFAHPVSALQVNTVPVKDASLNLAKTDADLLIAQVRFQPPPRSAPQTTVGAGSRYNRKPRQVANKNSCDNRQNQPLTALVPKEPFGLTIANSPTFFVYLPHRVQEPLKFTLYDFEQGRVIYKRAVTLPETPGILALPLPPTRNSSLLKLNRLYYWHLSVICDPQDSSQDVYVGGALQRVEPGPALAEALKQATPDDLPAIYAEAGMWYDALSSLASLRTSNPNDPSLQADWEQLLQFAGLERLTDQPLTQTPGRGY